MQDRDTLLRRSYAAFNARELGTVLKALADDVEWPDQLEGGVLHGHAAVGAYWERQWVVMEPHFEIKHIAEDAAGRTVVTLLQTVRGKDGHAISQGLVRHVYNFRDGLVVRMQILL